MKVHRVEIRCERCKDVRIIDPPEYIESEAALRRELDAQGPCTRCAFDTATVLIHVLEREDMN